MHLNITHFGKILAFRKNICDTVTNSVKFMYYSATIFYVRSTGRDIRSRIVDTRGPHVQGRSASYGKSYAWGSSARSNSKRGDPAKN
jgi:hypothetical protein